LATQYAFKKTFTDDAGDDHTDAIWCKFTATNTVNDGYSANYFAWSSAAKKVAGKSYIGGSLHQIGAIRNDYLNAVASSVEAGACGDLATYKADAIVDTFFADATLVSFDDTDSTGTLTIVS
jgi:hypothetical protein